MRNDVFDDIPPDAPPRRSSGCYWYQNPVAFLMTAIVSLIAGGVVGWLLRDRLQQEETRPPPQQIAQSQPKTATETAPWPECSAILAHLHENAGNPDSLQIVKWESREVTPWEWQGKRGTNVAIVVKIRGQSPLGGMVVDRYRFHFMGKKLSQVCIEEPPNGWRILSQY